MEEKEVYVAIDLGGGSGRVMAAYLEGSKLMLKCVHRFVNRQVRATGHIYWDILSLLAEIKKGLSMIAAQGMRIRSIGVDTWGVDFGLIDAAGHLLGNPICYRDPYSNPWPAEVDRQYGLDRLYARTGTQIMPINTLFQLLALKNEDPDMLEAASTLLFTPDLVSFFLTGMANTELSIASTSQMLDARSGTWADDLIEDLGLPAQIMPEIVAPGSIRGRILEDVAREIGIDYQPAVIAVGSHDTASAIHAMPPARGKCRAFLSSGTWSLLGVELDEPVLTPKANALGLTNERGACGQITLLQNITGLWIMQQLMAQWEREGRPVTFDVLIPAARVAHIDALIDVDDPAFHSPQNMEKAILKYCADHDMPLPSNQAEVTLCVLKSLARRYKKGIDALSQLLETPIDELRIIGGGAKNTLLTELTAAQLGIPVTSGPFEATAFGNVILQATALGDIDSASQITEFIELP